MDRWGRFIVVFACLLAAAAPAHARTTSAYAKAVLTACDTTTQFAVFEGRVTKVRGAARMQMRFTLQAATPDDADWRKIKAEGFGTWIAAPVGVARYFYDKRVEQLIAPASYRVQIDFRWRDASGKLLRTEKLTSPVCKQPDPRPDLHVRDTHVSPAADADSRRYVALLVNRGRAAAPLFDVDFLRAGEVIGTATVAGLGVGETTNAAIVAPACTPGEEIQVIVDPDNAVDEADEDDDTVSFTC
jgi:hypothetical protein